MLSPELGLLAFIHKNLQPRSPIKEARLEQIEQKKLARYLRVTGPPKVPELCAGFRAFLASSALLIRVAVMAEL
jgi:hypothetical protein